MPNYRKYAFSFNKGVFYPALLKIFEIFPLMGKGFVKLFSFVEKRFAKREVIVISGESVKKIRFYSTTQFLIFFSISLIVIILSIVSFVDTKLYIRLNKKDRKIGVISSANNVLQHKMKIMEEELNNIDQYLSHLDKKENSAPNRKIFGFNSFYHSTTVDKVPSKKFSLHDKTLSLEERINKKTNKIYMKLADRSARLFDMIKRTGLVDCFAPLNRAVSEKIVNHKTSYPSAKYFNLQGGPFIRLVDNMNRNIESRKCDFLGVIGFDQKLSIYNTKEIIDRLIRLENIVNIMPFGSPLRSYSISSHFGTRIDPLKHVMAVHKGTDLYSFLNDDVLATADGRVVFAGKNAGYGLFVEIEHKFGITTRYAHLNAIKVRLGQRINKKDVIGKLGLTGRATGAHLHYEVRRNNIAYDPMKFIVTKI